VFNWNGKRALDQCLFRHRSKENLVQTVRIIWKTPWFSFD